MHQSYIHLTDPLTRTEIRFDSKDVNASYNFADSFSRMLATLRIYSAQPVVVLCIGTDRSTGDALGPLIGTRLKEIGFTQGHIYGTLDEPVHATNLTTFIDLICSSHPQALTVAIDACLGRLDSVGHVTLARGPIKPGAGVNKTLPEVGDISITGIVNVGGFMEHFVLQNTRLSLVRHMAHVIASGLIKGFSIRH